ncbi:capsular biosynthesis protein [Croceicoccus estronivorus]|uniref:AAA family ATPase n=1 Tax=Croceicoccus estronivorus TaxID=1172626 RepID=UPI000835B310|nr:AAA family ATPase [Croceicoccus estronivorus]OCC23156.1 capsular biosynthesis protein [Croceicoccus estronivorus]
MTDQSNTPTPPKKVPDGNSLFERASNAFDLKGFKPAPVPESLAESPSKRIRSGMVRPSQPTRADERAQTATPDTPGTSPTDTVDQGTPDPVRFQGERRYVDRVHLREQGLIQPEGAVTGLLEEFRIVKRQLLEVARSSLAGRGVANGQRVLICSPHPGEGKTFCAVNLALAMAAEKDSEVLLVDADFAKPSVLSALGLEGGPGFMDALADPSIKVEDCVIATDVPGLYVLPAGNQTNNDSEYLASSRTVELLDCLTRGAPNRMVIFDSPPALAASPAAELAKYVGQAVLVARADRTGQNALEDACSLLSGCPDIKLLLNAAHFSPSGRKFGSYYGYGG